MEIAPNGPEQGSFPETGVGLLSSCIGGTRVPVKKVETPGGDGVFYSLRRGFNNAWAANGGPFNFPVKLRITSVLDDVIEGGSLVCL